MYFDDNYICEGHLPLVNKTKKFPYKSDVTKIPLENNITFVLYEVGCSINGRAKQLEELRFRLFRTWSVKVRPHVSSDINVIRVVASYESKTNDLLIGRRTYGWDVDIRYDRIPSETLEKMPDEEKNFIASH